ncbi:MAG: hypothetical protein HY985_00570 [Magnetospirillum sp.]|nr:hypothetical protein [Magnetospirillum sp.]
MRQIDSAILAKPLSDGGLATFLALLKKRNAIFRTSAMMEPKVRMPEKSENNLLLFNSVHF